MSKGLAQLIADHTTDIADLVAEALTFLKHDGSRFVTGDILPHPSDTYSLGSFGRKFKHLYVSHTLFVGGVCDFYSGGGHLTLPSESSGQDMNNEIWFEPSTNRLWIFNGDDLEWVSVLLSP